MTSAYGSAPRARATSSASSTSSVAPSPMTNPSRSASNGRQAWLGSSFRPSDSARMMSNAPNASGLSGTSTPPAIAASISPARIALERLADRDGPGRARVGGREDRPADVERDPEVRRRRAAEHREGEVRRDRLDAPLEVALVLAPRRRRSRRARCRGRSRSAPAPRRRPRPAAARRPRGRAGPATSPNWLNRSSWRAVFGGIHASGSKSSTWAATWLRNGDGSNRSIRLIGERPARSPARNASTPVPIAVIGPMPVIQTRAALLMSRIRRRTRFRTSRRTASASRRNVASVRPAIGRVKRAVDRARPSRARAAGSRARSRPGCRPAGAVLDPPRHVHAVRRAAAMDEPQPARRLGSAHVSDRQATGSPRPRTGHERPAGDEPRRARRPASSGGAAGDAAT